MTGAIPRMPLALGVAGLIPFVWCVVTLWSDGAAALTAQLFGSRFTGPFLQLGYGTVILSFMSGVLWGFATRAAEKISASAYCLSVIPALWVFLFVGGGPTTSAIYLIVGFAGLLGIDWIFWKQNLAPHWWMRLRTMLTVVTLVCLGLTLAAIGG